MGTPTGHTIGLLEELAALAAEETAAGSLRLMGKAFSRNSRSTSCRPRSNQRRAFIWPMNR